MSEWISVKDRLPKHGEYVLCYFRGSKQYEALAFYFVAENGDLVWKDATDCFNYRNGVTHWMPLPEPPEEVQDDG